MQFHNATYQRAITQETRSVVENNKKKERKTSGSADSGGEKEKIGSACANSSLH